MGKYNEVMEHVAVTEEMRERVLRNVRAHAAGAPSSVPDKTAEIPPRGRKTVRIWIPLTLAAAAAVILLFAVRPWQRDPGGSPQDTQVTALYSAEEFPSAAALSEAVGFPVPEIRELPFEETERSYISISGNIAEIDYLRGEESLTFRMAPGTEDQSGNYNEYAESREATAGGIPVTLKGEDGKCFLAVWTDGDYAYSLDDSQGLDEEAVLRMIGEIMEK